MQEFLRPPLSCSKSYDVRDLKFRQDTIKKDQTTHSGIWPEL